MLEPEGITTAALSIEAEQKEFSAVSSMATLGQIEAQISAGQAIYYNNGIVVVINLSFAGSSIAEILSKMAGAAAGQPAEGGSEFRD